MRVTEETHRFVLATSLVDLLLQLVMFSLEGLEALHDRFLHARQRLLMATEERSHLCLHSLHLREQKEHLHDNCAH